MSVHRFYVPGTGLKSSTEIDLPESTARQVTKVLRLRTGNSITLFDGSGSEWPATVTNLDDGSVRVAVGEPSVPGSEATLQVTVCQALLPSERMEYAIQKCTELGMARFAPVTTERVQSKDAKPSEQRLERWRRIAVEAAEQSGRTRVPDILAPDSLDSSLGRFIAKGPVIMLWEEERARTLRDAVRESLRKGSEHLTVLIGPVGGLSGGDIDAGKSAGAVTAGAGPRILRAETAPVVALTALMYEAGELG